MTATKTAPGRTKDPKAGTATIVAERPDLTVPYLNVEYSHTTGAVNFTDESGTPLAGTLTIASAAYGEQVGLGRAGGRGGNPLHDLWGGRIEAAIQQHGARAVVVAESTVADAARRYVAVSPSHRAKLAYEQAAVQTPGGLLAMPGYDEWRAEWEKGQPVEEEPLEKLRAELQIKLAIPNDVAVLLVVPTGAHAHLAADTGDGRGDVVEGPNGHIRGQTRGDNPYFQQGIDPSAKSLLEARAAASPVGTRGDRTPVGRTDDPAAHASNPDAWGIMEPGTTEPLPARTRHPLAPQSPSTYSTPDAPPDPASFAVPEFELGVVTELTPQASHALGVQAAGLGAAPRFAQLYSSGGNLFFSWGGIHERWSAGSSGSALGEFNASEWALAMARNVVDVTGPRPQVLLADVKDLDVDLGRLAQVLPVVTLPEATS